MLNKIKYLIVAALIFSLASCSGKPSTLTVVGSDPAKTVATVNGKPITEGEVLTAVASDMKKLQGEIYKIERAGLDQLIDKKLIEEAAAKEGKNADSYLDNYVKENVKEPTEEEVKKYYEFRKKQMGDKSFDEVKKNIEDFLVANQKNALQRQLLGKLRKDANVKIELEPPRVEIEVGNSPTMGKKGAPVTVVEFSDYQCPFCSRARPTINQIVEAYPNEVLYVFKDFPLSFHKDAQKAHEAAHCAGDQGKYWEMNKEIFANQKALSISDLKGYAKKIGLNMSKFDKCLNENKYEKSVQASIQEGAQAGVSGTPAFFVNGVLISGARPFADFKQAIDSELNK